MSDTTSFRRIGDVMDFDARLAQVAAARQQYRSDRIATFGWSESVNCPSCGDTGRIPDDNSRPCFCAIGETIAEQEQLEADWQTRCPRRFRSYSLGSHPNRVAVQAVRQWLTSGMRRGQNLVLSGPVGTGKSGLAIGALRQAHVDGVNVRFGTVPDLLDAMRPTPNVSQTELGMTQIQRVPLLLMDDLGVEKATEWAVERMYMAINGRYERELPTIVTTNRTLPELRDMIGERTVSRLTEDAAMVAVGGQDLRRAS